MGGKARQGAEIAQIIQRLDAKKHNTHSSKSMHSPYWEPFVGMCGVMRHIKAPLRIGSDVHHDVIEMWKAVQQGWDPPSSCSKQRFNMLKNSTENAHLRGFVGHAMTFRGVFFSSYYDDGTRCQVGRRNVLDVGRDVQDVQFLTGSYSDIVLPKNMSFVIYCDPPYDDGTNTLVGAQNRFDSKKFWKWAREQSKRHTLVVSEKSAPKDFVPIWQSSDKIPHYLFVSK